MSGPRTSIRPKQVFASFDPDSSPAGMTTHRPSASLLKDTPPSIIVALSHLAPIVRNLNRILALITWTGRDNWSSFLLLAAFWLLCLYGDVVFHYAGNWVVLFFLGVGYFRKRTQTTGIVHAIEEGDNPITTGIEDTQKVMDATLYEIDCLRARCHLLSSTAQPLYRLFTWEDPQQSAMVGMRLALVTPLYVAALWFFTVRVLLLVTGTFLLTFTSPWFKVILTVCWRLRIVRRLASAVVGADYLPAETDIRQILTPSSATAAAVSSPADATRSNLASPRSGDSRFTTTIAVIENQRRWLGLGWTPSLLPHERAPFTDTDDRPGAAPENTALPAPKTTGEGAVSRTVHWTWLDPAWRIERDRGRDGEGWLYFDNAWRHPTPTEEFGKYTRRRRWIRNAECHESVQAPPAASEAPSRTLSPQKVTVSTHSLHADETVPSPSPPTVAFVATQDRDEGTKVGDSPSGPDQGPRREWRLVDGGGRELVTTNHVPTIKKRPLALRRKSSRASNVSLPA
ncbi:Integral peroxisomal membrane protein [Taphrina deformans PYCC 5710]|uniref:Integral peroxisomal membrane protein n=1 Tax=Taphrina deformans (strain PYCC 5710 / ATCC 11124 / CBS 356.35 / IMI 108563 / JCM 9778 / NBRC 8474) TaxID=1097556 RepID=R4X7K0_TAPDE|nr:Integral peroxisomal membrane protein [Taphrina deformans PYCC 5710]|eukprot:CCG81375.1 Integral peroxisomal membrane protein [Taphrina deformans PYCC 5710]